MVGFVRLASLELLRRCELTFKLSSLVAACESFTNVSDATPMGIAQLWTRRFSFSVALRFLPVVGSAYILTNWLPSYSNILCIIHNVNIIIIIFSEIIVDGGAKSRPACVNILKQHNEPCSTSARSLTRKSFNCTRIN